MQDLIRRQKYMQTIKRNIHLHYFFLLFHLFGKYKFPLILMQIFFCSSIFITITNQKTVVFFNYAFSSNPHIDSYTTQCHHNFLKHFLIISFNSKQFKENYNYQRLNNLRSRTHNFHLKKKRTNKMKLTHEILIKNTMLKCTKFVLHSWRLPFRSVDSSPHTHLA